MWVLLLMLRLCRIDLILTTFLNINGFNSITCFILVVRNGFTTVWLCKTHSLKLCLDVGSWYVQSSTSCRHIRSISCLHIRFISCLHIRSISCRHIQRSSWCCQTYFITCPPKKSLQLSSYSVSTKSLISCSTT